MAGAGLKNLVKYVLHLLHSGHC